MACLKAHKRRESTLRRRNVNALMRRNVVCWDTILFYRRSRKMPSDPWAPSSTSTSPSTNQTAAPPCLSPWSNGLRS
jgi:hypothetical protein